MNSIRKTLVASIALAGLLGIGSLASAAPNSSSDNQAPPTSSVAAPSKVTTDPQVKAGGTSLAAPAATCEYPIDATNAALQTKVITSSTARYYTNLEWMDLACGSLTVTVPRGKAAGVTVDANAELTCTHISEADTTQWCEGRVLVNHTDGFPVETEADGSFAWAHSETDFGAWESNTMSRSRTLRCPENSPGDCSYNVRVQVKVHAPNLEFRVDGSHVRAQLTYS